MLWRPPLAPGATKRSYDAVSLQAGDTISILLHIMKDQWPRARPEIGQGIVGDYELRELSNGLSHQNCAETCVTLATMNSSWPIELRASQLALYLRFWYDHGPKDEAPIRAALQWKMLEVIADLIPPLKQARGSTTAEEASRLSDWTSLMAVCFRIFHDGYMANLDEAAVQFASTNLILLTADWSLNHPFPILTFCELS